MEIKEAMVNENIMESANDLTTSGNVTLTDFVGFGLVAIGGYLTITYAIKPLAKKAKEKLSDLRKTKDEVEFEPLDDCETNNL